MLPALFNRENSGFQFHQFGEYLFARLWWHMIRLIQVPVYTASKFSQALCYFGCLIAMTEL